MASRPITVDAPDKLIEFLGSPEAVADGMRRALVLDLLRRAEVSQGWAAEALDIDRWEMLQLMVEYQIPSGPESREELRKDIEAVRRMRSPR